MTPPKLTAEDVHALAVAYRCGESSGPSCADLAVAYGVNRSTIASRLRQAGYTLRPPVTAMETRPTLITAAECHRAAKLYRQGMTMRAVGEVMFMSASAVGRRLDRIGVQRRPKGWLPPLADGYRFPGHQAMDETVRLYRSGLSCYEVGEALGVADSTVCRRLHVAGVQLRPAGESMKLRWARRPKARARQERVAA